MKAETIFQICNSVAPLGWLLMVAAPRWRWTRAIVLTGILPLMLGLVYTALILLHFGESEGNFGSLQGVAQLFQNPFALTAGWVHYLAFDMFIGAWELNDSQKQGISHWLMIPCLFFTFLFGPIGLILYFSIRGYKTKRFLHDIN